MKTKKTKQAYERIRDVLTVDYLKLRNGSMSCLRL